MKNKEEYQDVGNSNKHFKLEGTRKNEQNTLRRKVRPGENKVLGTKRRLYLRKEEVTTAPHAARSSLMSAINM